MCKLIDKIPCSKCNELLCENYPEPDCPITRKYPECDLLIQYQILQIAHSELLRQYLSLLEDLHR